MATKIAGFDKVSFNNFMGDVCSAAFISGCNLKCPYCHNPWLIKKQNTDLREDFLKHLEKRKKIITIAVVSGGEPTLDRELVEFITEIKRIVPKVKLDTNGTKPSVIEKLIELNLINYIAMDVKGPLYFYKEYFGLKESPEIIGDSIKLIQGSRVKHEFRLTVADPFIGKEEIKNILSLVNPAHLIIQPFVYSGKILNEIFAENNKRPSFNYLNELNILCGGKAYVRTFYPETSQLYGKVY